MGGILEVEREVDLEVERGVERGGATLAPYLGCPDLPYPGRLDLLISTQPMEMTKSI